ncbi:MAG TPA: pentapeptide repeat-containing protein [Roseiarcus sp.]|nr:pentapeptide repeat-containing protein [Roseiarcus sp.]
MGLDPSAPNERPAKGGGEVASAGGRAASEPLRAELAVPAFAPEQPPISAKADDLEAIKKAVEDAASVSGALWFSYLFVLFYLAVAAGAVTHADLFLENPVRLPFLNIDLPLLAFFFLAPILFVITHAYTLVHLVLLTDKAKRFHQALHARIGTEDDRAMLQRLLPINIFVQLLAGPKDIRDSAFGWLLQAIAWVTLVVAPVLLLLLMQLQFLPFHSSFITWTHRIGLVVDLTLLWWLWRKILSGREIDFPRRRASWAALTIGLVVSAAAVLYSSAVAVFPGEWQEDHLPHFVELWRGLSLQDLAFQLPDNASFSINGSLPGTLVLSGLNIYEGLKVDDPEKVKWRDYIFRARGRDLQGANFDFASLPKVDFTGADLRGASLVNAELQGASFVEAKLQGTNFERAKLQVAWLSRAKLEGADLNEAQLQGARLDGAELGGASLVGAGLQGAFLVSAKFQGASLGLAQLQGASLDRAQLRGASLDHAQLQGASLQVADLEATDLSNAFLWRTNRVEARPADIEAPKLTAVRLKDGFDPWQPSLWPSRGNRKEPHPWDDKAYRDLRGTMESLPPGAYRDYALDRIQRLDCANPDPSLASCDPSLPPPAEAAAWRKSLEDARVDDATYARAIAAVWKKLVCSGDDEALYALRGPLQGFPDPLEAAGPEAPALIDFITSKDCPISSSLTADDKASLLSIKQGVIAKTLATEMKTLVCSGHDDAASVLHGLIAAKRLEAVGPETEALVDFIMSKDCPVSNSLTAADKADLLRLKHNATGDTGD